jgi:hypothetical protein
VSIAARIESLKGRRSFNENARLPGMVSNSALNPVDERDSDVEES